MIKTTRDRAGRRLFIFGEDLPARQADPGNATNPDWIQARKGHIDKALARASQLPSGGWYVLDASRRITSKPAAFWVDGNELVAWRAGGKLLVAPNACPHMGAPLSAGRVCDGELECPWHGLRLGDKKHGKWAPLHCHDDGVLCWVRLDGDEAPTPEPVLAPRPARSIAGVIRMAAQCEPPDVIANRLDPWHGAWFHPHSFARLEVLDETAAVLTVRVAFRLFGPLCVEVDCTFHCPDPRTIVMTIVAGEGVGSVVETHATPMAPGWTAVVEATLASSGRQGFAVARHLTPLVRPFVERSARRLWVEDAAYAERTHFLRKGGGVAPFPGGDWTAVPGTPRQR